MIHELFAPPRLRLPEENRDRHTTWLETFYDLVFVVAVSTLSSRLSGNVTLQGVLQFLGPGWGIPSMIRALIPTISSNVYALWA